MSLDTRPKTLSILPFLYPRTPLAFSSRSSTPLSKLPGRHWAVARGIPTGSRVDWVDRVGLVVFCHLQVVLPLQAAFLHQVVLPLLPEILRDVLVNQGAVPEVVAWEVSCPSTRCFFEMTKGQDLGVEQGTAQWFDLSNRLQALDRVEQPYEEVRLERVSCLY
jgi:hypothetical protein